MSADMAQTMRHGQVFVDRLGGRCQRDVVFEEALCCELLSAQITSICWLQYLPPRVSALGGTSRCPEDSFQYASAAWYFLTLWLELLSDIPSKGEGDQTCCRKLGVFA